MRSLGFIITVVFITIMSTALLDTTSVDVLLKNGIRAQYYNEDIIVYLKVEERSQIANRINYTLTLLQKHYDDQTIIFRFNADEIKLNEHDINIYYELHMHERNEIIIRLLEELHRIKNQHKEKKRAKDK